MTTEFNMNDFAGFEQAIFQKGLINTKKNASAEWKSSR